MSDSERNIILRSFSKVWRIERFIYRIERIRLPFAVTFRQAGFFLFGVAVMLKLSDIPVIGEQNVLFRMVGVPVAFAWFMTKLKFDGKSPPRYFWCLLNYYLSPHRLSLYRSIEIPKKKFKVNEIIVCRRQSRRRAM